MILGIGTDLVAVSRLARAVERTPRFLERVFTPEERAYCLAQKNPYPSLAARFAAKEAVFKAFGGGWGRFSWQEAAVRRQPGGQPVVSLSGRLARLAQAQGDAAVMLSLSHEGDLAVAFVVVTVPEQGAKEVAT